MKGNKATVLTLAQKCKSILTSNWQASLNTIRADAKGSTEEIYTSKVRYFVKGGKPYIWVPQDDLHNVNATFDERGSFAVTTPFPGPLASLFRSIGKAPARVALTGDVVPLKGGKLNLAVESLRKTISLEREVIGESSFSVSSLLKSSGLGCTPRSTKLQELLDGNEEYTVYKFDLRWYGVCTGETHEVDLECMEVAKADPLAPFSASLVDGINQSEARRRALMLFFIAYLKRNAKDAYIVSVDREGFDVLGKVVGPTKNDGSRQFQWEEFRITFTEEARDLEVFCQRLLEMEETALKSVSSFTGFMIDRFM